VIVYVPIAFALTLPEAVTATLPAQASLAVAPGSVKAAWHSVVIGLGPLSVIFGGVVSTTLTVRVFVPVSPAGSVAE
jgi:hypothetical protein